MPYLSPLAAVVIVLVLSLTGVSVAKGFCQLIGTFNPSAGAGCAVYVKDAFDNPNNWLPFWGTGTAGLANPSANQWRCTHG